MKQIYYIYFLLITPFVAGSPLPDFPFVHVHGVAIKKIEPNIATIRFDIITFHKKPSKAEEALSEIASSIYDQITSLGITDENAIAGTTRKTTARSEDEYGNYLDILGYELERSITIRLDDLKTYPDLIDFIYKLENIEELTVNFGRNDAEELQQQLVAEAGIDAKAKADRLAEGFGSKTKSVKAISESSFSGIFGEYGLPEGTSHRYGARSMAGGDFRVIPATITIRKGVYAIFEIE